MNTRCETIEGGGEKIKKTQESRFGDKNGKMKLIGVRIIVRRAGMDRERRRESRVGKVDRDVKREREADIG